jgi:hemolysin activation/secretion protein
MRPSAAWLLATSPGFDLRFPPRPCRPVISAVLALLCCAGPLAAQTLPSAAEPGRAPLRPLLPQSSPAAPSVQLPQGAATEAPAGADALHFVLRDLAIEGVTAYSADALRPLYAGLLGRQISVAEAYALAQRLELRYREDGFITSRVVVPAQTLGEDGRLRLVVVEGFVSELRYEADIGPARAAVERLLAPLRGVRPVRLAEIERRLLLANDVAGLTVRATLEPAPTELGASVLVVRADRRASETTVAAGNRASPYLGLADVVVSQAWNAIGARADRVQLHARLSAPTRRHGSLGASYDALLTQDGLSASLSGQHAVSRPGRELEVLDVRSEANTLSAGLSYPLIRSREQNLRAQAQFELRDMQTRMAGVDFSHDRLRVLRLSLSYDRADSWDGVSAVRGTVHKGLPVFGASARGAALASRADGDPDFLKFTLDLTRLQQLSRQTSLVMSVTGQWSRHALLASEEFSLGGGSFGRAYDEGEIAADRGVAGSLELRYAPSLPAFSGPGGYVYGFIDGGRLHAARGGMPVSQRGLASAGVGLRAHVGDSVFATLEVAKPLNHPVRTRGDQQPRVFVSLNASF